MLFFVKLFIIFDKMFFSCYDYYRVGDIMNIEYDFNWLVGEIDNSIILKLLKDKEVIGVYQVNEILDIALNPVKVKFAVINDLLNFVNYTIVRFVDVNDRSNIIDIPFRKIWLLYLNGTMIGEKVNKRIKLSKLEAKFYSDGQVLKDNDYYVYSYKVNEESEELGKVMKIAFDFRYLGMQQTSDALANLNLINYKMDNKSTKKKRT